MQPKHDTVTIYVGSIDFIGKLLQVYPNPRLATLKLERDRLHDFVTILITDDFKIADIVTSEKKLQRVTLVRSNINKKLGSGRRAVQEVNPPFMGRRERKLEKLLDQQEDYLWAKRMYCNAA